MTTQATTETAAPTTETTTTTIATETANTTHSEKSSDSPPAEKTDAKPDGKEATKKEGDGDLLFEEKKDKADDADSADDEKEKKDSEEEKPPITVDFEKIKVPEGMTISEENQKALADFVNKHNLSQEGAQEAVQELADLGAKMQQVQIDKWMDMKKEWRSQVEADKELGGQNLTKTIAECNDVVRKFAGDEANLKEFQNDLIFLGLGNKPSFVRFLKNINAATKEDGLDGKSANTQTPTKTMAQRMYPDMPSESSAS